MDQQMLRVPLHATPEQKARLDELQRSFARVCNTLAPVVQQRRLWHRVTLHHLMYRSLREEFPALGSQMVCNAIYSVCRSARLVYQNPSSPFSLAALQGAPLPLLGFRDSSPVFLDRHTVSLKEGMASLYTLEGRIHCRAEVRPADAARFQQDRLHEAMLLRGAAGDFELAVRFGPDAAAAPGGRRRPQPPVQIPDYLLIGARA